MNLNFFLSLVFLIIALLIGSRMDRYDDHEDKTPVIVEETYDGDK